MPYLVTSKHNLELIKHLHIFTLHVASNLDNITLQLLVYCEVQGCHRKYIIIIINKS